MTIPTYKQQSPLTGKLVNSDNEVLDVQQFLESGEMLVTATSSPTPVVPVAEATVPKYQNLTPWASKMVNSENLVIDLIQFLMSGQVKVQVGGGVAPTSATYITQADETATLPDSFPLSTLTTGFMSVEAGTGILNARTLQQTINQINISNASGLAGSPAFSLSSTLVFPGTVSFGGSSATINNIDNTGTSFLSTDTMTALGIQTAISDQIDMGTSFRGGWDASGGTFPTTGGTGTAGAIESGNWWFITVAGTLAGQDVSVGDEITALVDTPGQTGSNWLVSAQKVSSVFNRDGPVVAELGDYDINKITNGINNTIAWVYSDVSSGGAPLPNYDSTAGFLHGSFYRDSVTGYNYVCIDAEEDAAVWERLCPTSASYTNNSLALNVNGNTSNTEIVPLEPTNVTYLAENGSDVTGRTNSSAFPFASLQAASNAIKVLADSIGNVLHVYAQSGGGAYGNLVLDGFTGWEILGFGDYVTAGDLEISDASITSFVGSSAIQGVYWNNLTYSNHHDQVDGTKFRFGAFNDYVMDNESTATNGISSGNTFIDMEFVGSIIYFPGGYAKQLTSITETYIGCKFGGTMTINGTTTSVRFIACQNIPTIIYANGATSAQVTIIGVNSFNTRSGNVMPASGDYSFSLISGTAAVSQGGTGATSVGASGTLAQSNGSIYGFTTATFPSAATQGDILYASASNVWSSLAKNTTATRYLSNTGTSNSPEWEAIDLSNGTKGTLVATSGGTAQSTYTTGDILYASATNTLSKLAIGSSTQVLTVSGGVPTWAAAAGGGLTFNAVSSSTQALAVNNSYYTTYSGLNVMTLPSTAAVGSIIQIIAGPSGNTFKVAQNYGESIYYGAKNGVSQVTTTGTGGSLQSTDPNTSVTLICIVANTTWAVLYNINDLTIT